MSEKDAIKRIEEECFTGDPEIDHDNADSILCEFLESLGYSDLVEIYNEVDKYYT